MGPEIKQERTSDTPRVNATNNEPSPTDVEAEAATASQDPASATVPDTPKTVDDHGGEYMVEGEEDTVIY